MTWSTSGTLQYGPDLIETVRKLILLSSYTVGSRYSFSQMGQFTVVLLGVVPALQFFFLSP